MPPRPIISESVTMSWACGPESSVYSIRATIRCHRSLRGRVDILLAYRRVLTDVDGRDATRALAAAELGPGRAA